MSTAEDDKLIMVALEGFYKLESAIRVWTRDEIVSGYSFLSHSRTLGSDDLM